MTYRILIAEDDVQIREVISDYFSAQPGDSMELTFAVNGAEAGAFLKPCEFDLVLLDIMMPEIDGFTVCRELRAVSDVPVIFLTARAREEDLLYGYELGCDDYITKPFSLAQLYAKTLALLRRSKGTVISREMVCGGIRMNLTTLEVSADGNAVTLAPREFALLKYLMEHKNWVVSRDQLLDRIWGTDYFGSPRVVDNHIKKLRQALGSAGTQIKTVIARGYQLTEK